MRSVKIFYLTQNAKSSKVFKYFSIAEHFSFLEKSFFRRSVFNVKGKTKIFNEKIETFFMKSKKWGKCKF